MNATELLKQDHREVENLMMMLEDETTASNDIFERLKSTITLHTQVEEEIFYPAMEEFDETLEMVERSYDEHSEVEQILEDMTGLNPQDEEFQDLLVELRDSVNLHAQEEETEVFPKAEELLGEEELSAIGNEIEQMKNNSGLNRSVSVN
jgi:Hemerythrin HHE cation binding domain.